MKFNPSGEALVMASTAKEGAVRIVHFPSMTVFENFPASNNLARVNCVGFRCLILYHILHQKLTFPFSLQSWRWIPQLWKQQGLCFTLQTWPLSLLLNVFCPRHFPAVKNIFFVLPRIFRVKNVTVPLWSEICQTNN